MIHRLFVGVLVLLLASPAFAHRTDEYLQAALLSIDRDHVHGYMSLVPGIAVAALVISRIDTNGDGSLSASEQRAYASDVLNDISLAVNGRRLGTRLVSARFPTFDEMREGVGEIQLEFDADVAQDDRERTLVFENRHAHEIGAYLVNCLVPRDASVKIIAQRRSEDQSVYRLAYARSSPVPDLPATPARNGTAAALALVACGVSAWLVRFARMRFAKRRPRSRGPSIQADPIAVRRTVESAKVRAARSSTISRE